LFLFLYYNIMHFEMMFEYKTYIIFNITININVKRITHLDFYHLINVRHDDAHSSGSAKGVLNNITQL